MSIEESSQFASALLLAGRIGGWQIEIVGENAEESPYVRMTSELIKAFPHHGGEFQIEPDASSGSYFWAAGRLSEGGIKVLEWPISNWQIDGAFPDVIENRKALGYGLGLDVLGAKMQRIHGESKAVWDEVFDKFPAALPNPAISRESDLGDSIMTAIVLAPFTLNSARFTDLGRLRVQECERVVALRTELTKCGTKVVEEDDTLTVYRSKLHGAEIETYNDHRMAMCFGVLGLKVPGMKIRNPACVKKTFPNFWQKLAAAPPHGLGATILDARTGQLLNHDELFAD